MLVFLWEQISSVLLRSVCFLFVWSLESTQQVHTKCNSFSCKNWMNRCTTLFCHHRLVQFSKAFTLASSKRSTERYLLIKKYLFASGKDAFVCTYIISPYPKRWMWPYTSCFLSLRPVKVSVYLRRSNIGVPVLHYSLAIVIIAIIVA